MEIRKHYIERKPETFRTLLISNIENKSSDTLTIELLDSYKSIIQEIKKINTHPPEQIIESVHLTRKRLKFLRALVKLTKYCNSDESYKTINYIFRDSGRLLSECRDAHVRSILLSEFKKNESLENSYAELEALNHISTKKIEKTLLLGKTVFEKIITNISEKHVFEYFQSLDADLECLFAGLILGYQKSYNTFYSESISHDSHLLHEWRKRTKDLQYQFEALPDSISKYVPQNFDEVSELCEKLGRINDLFMLLEWLDSIEASVEFEGKIPELKSELNQELKRLNGQVRNIGLKIYNISPKEFGEELNNRLER